MAWRQLFLSNGHLVKYFLHNYTFIPSKAILSESSPSKERVLEALKSLGTKTPSREILRKTNLGLVLNDFRKNDDAEISELASKTYRKVSFQ